MCFQIVKGKLKLIKIIIKVKEKKEYIIV